MKPLPEPSANGAPRRGRFWLRIAVVILIIFSAIALVVYFILDEPLPTGTPGPAADSLARRMMTAIGHDHWEKTGAVRWKFAGKHEHLWDRRRHLARVRWEDIEVLLDIATRTGVAWRNGKQLAATEARTLVQSAWEKWCNDSFWLNPISKLFDPGTVRELVAQKNGGAALLIRYTQGGVTPGDAYLWVMGSDDLPVKWKMWVKIIPIGGLEFSWENWMLLSTGVKISTLHRSGPFRLQLTDVAGAATLPELEPGEDPFAPLLRSQNKAVSAGAPFLHSFAFPRQGSDSAIRNRE